MSRIAYVPGTFDLFHTGHLRLLAGAAALVSPGGSVVVGVNTDEFVVRYKGVAPIVPFADRVAVLESCGHVGRVVCNEGGEDSRPVIEKAFGLRPAVASLGPLGDRLIVHGDDWVGPPYLAQLGVTQGWLEERGIMVVFLGYTGGVSTSGIVERVLARSSGRGSREAGDPGKIMTSRPGRFAEGLARRALAWRSFA